MLHELVRVVFKPGEIRQEKEAKERKRLESANRLERLATTAYMEGKISVADYQLMNELLSPITRIDFVKLADEISKKHH